ncbi:MAG TPA: amidohydrolase family protein [Verrucomicrobiae bacterium]|nr:amidohydrolase family protein [Verrucomicrobiae bacterium]
MQIELPGLFDLQVNGFAGVDFNNPATTSDDLFRAMEKIRATGVTRFLPTLITSSFERFAQCARTLTQLSHPAIAGLHMEGPYIAPEDGPRGAHPREFVTDASIDDFKRRQDAADGKIRLVTLSPEVPGAIALMEHLVGNGVRVAIGHTAATPEQIRDAIKAGASLSTHLGNGCAQLLPRHPNFIWEQLAADELVASLIVDGHHLPAATVKVMVRAKAPARTILISDATGAAGCPPGQYELSGATVVLDENGRVSQPGKPWLAGSALCLDQAIANAVRMTGLPLETVWAMASTQPANYLGLQPAGKVTVNWDANGFRLTELKVNGA